MKGIAISIIIIVFVNQFSALCQSKLLLKDTLNNGNADRFRKVKPYKDVIPATAITHRGLLTIHQVEGKYYFEIPNNLFNTDILLVTRIAKGAAERKPFVGDNKTFSGDELTNMVIKFEKAPGDRIFLRKILSSTYIGDSSSTMYNSIVRSNVLPILASFEIEAFSPDSTGIVFNAGDFILGDNELFSFNAVQKKVYSLSTQALDKSIINYISSFPLNLEINTLKTYSKSIPAYAYSNGSLMSADVIDNATYELNTSLVLLPEKPMQKRFNDPRIGYFSLQVADYDINPQSVKTSDYIKRWRLEPHDEDIEKFKRGELVDPQKQIVFYIDPATPLQWIPYLIQGVNDWQVAFEQAGFKNAIIAKTAPTKEQDSTWSLYDARHSAIVYKPSEIENASGPSITDPRTGEILESHINWYHNVMQLIHDWYMVQCGVLDPRAQRMIYDDSLMGQLIRFVSSHEVGHALGLLHNMGASSTVPTEKLRNKAWVEANGFCPSIMDYARFNYVAQPEDNISEKGLMPRIGKYDKWAIEWGYRVIPKFPTTEAENHFLNQWVIEKAKDKQLQFFSEASWDPRNQKEDLGDNAVIASKYGIKNLQRTIPKLLEWTRVQDEGYMDLNRVYKRIQTQFNTYVVHVVTCINGGLYENIKSVEQPGPVYELPAIASQREAMKFLEENIFTTPLWIVDTAILNRTGQTALGVIGQIQQRILNSLFYPPYLATMYSRNESTFGLKTYTLLEFFDDLKNSVWGDLYTHKPVDIYRANLQKTYIATLSTAFNSSKANSIMLGLPFSGAITLYASGVSSLIYSHLVELKQGIKRNLQFVKDKATKSHFEYLYYKIDRYLNEDNKLYGY